MNKKELTEAIRELPDEVKESLPKGWYNKSEENLQELLDELAPTKTEKHITDVEIRNESKNFLKQLQSEEYVDIEIDPSTLYPEGSTVPIGLNGVTFYVPVGILFEKGVPSSIKAVWDYSKKETRKTTQSIASKLTGEIRIQ